MGSLILPSSGPVYADALIFIYSVEKHPTYALSLRSLWEAVARGDLEVLSSSRGIGKPTLTTYQANHDVSDRIPGLGVFDLKCFLNKIL
jgi:hypothetical protein